MDVPGEHVSPGCSVAPHKIVGIADPRAVSQAVLGATLYEPTAAVEVGYLDRVVESEALSVAAGQAAREMLHLDGAAFAETKRRFRSATVDRINRAGRP